MIDHSNSRQDAQLLPLGPVPTIVWPLLAGLLSVGLYMFNLGRPPHPDELYHMLAARGFIETGEFRIADGIYERGALQTWMSAQAMIWLGDSLAVARLPSVLIMGLVNSLLAFWLVKRAGLTASLIAVALFAISPFAVETAQLVRFYAPQVMAFLLGTILVFEARRDARRWWLFGPPALACFWLAMDLQPTSVMGLVALMIWLGVSLIPAWVGLATGHRSKHKLLAIALPLLAILAGIAVVLSPMGADFWYQYRWVPAFNRHVSDQFYFYHGWFILYYPAVWPFLGLICLLAIRSRPDIGFMCSVLFCLSFLLASFAGTKSLRYFVFAQPFFFTVIGLALAPSVGSCWRAIGRLRADLAEMVPIFGERGRRLVAQILIGLAIAFFVLANGAVVRTVGLMAGFSIGPEKPDVDWRAALPALRPYLEDTDIVVTQSDLEMFYYLGDFDLFVVPPGVDGRPDEADFSNDFRTGRTVIGTLPAVQQVLACYDRGLWVSNVRRWGDASMSNEGIEKFVAANAQPIELASGSRMLAFHWDARVAPDDFDCSDMPESTRNRVYE